MSKSKNPFLTDLLNGNDIETINVPETVVTPTETVVETISEIEHPQNATVILSNLQSTFEYCQKNAVAVDTNYLLNVQNDAIEIVVTEENESVLAEIWQLFDEINSYNATICEPIVVPETVVEVEAPKTKKPRAKKAVEVVNFEAVKNELTAFLSFENLFAAVDASQRQTIRLNAEKFGLPNKNRFCELSQAGLSNDAKATLKAVIRSIAAKYVGDGDARLQNFDGKILLIDANSRLAYILCANISAVLTVDYDTTAKAHEAQLIDELNALNASIAEFITLCESIQQSEIEARLIAANDSEPKAFESESDENPNDVLEARLYAFYSAEPKALESDDTNVVLESEFVNGELIEA